MPRIAYVNGAYRPLSEAAVHVEDRGFQFADGIYEVVLCVDGRLWDLEGHLVRWRRSLGELSIEEPMAPSALKMVIRQLLRANRLKNAIVYMQATRGAAPRNHAFPSTPVKPTLVLTARPFMIEKYHDQAARGVKVVTTPDIRWGRVDIKTTGLLPNALAKEFAKHEGAYEAWLLKDGFVTEGSSTNAWIVRDDGTLVTHPLGHSILGGVTRLSIIECARNMQLRVIEEAFTLDDALRAREAFITSASALATPVIAIDGRPIGGGAPGPIAQRLRASYIARMESGELV
jgi:D-alanine transaminase